MADPLDSLGENDGVDVSIAVKSPAQPALTMTPLVDRV
jgi:hypothetical protein